MTKVKAVVLLRQVIREKAKERIQRERGVNFSLSEHFAQIVAEWKEESPLLM